MLIITHLHVEEMYDKMPNYFHILRIIILIYLNLRYYIFDILNCWKVHWWQIRQIHVDWIYLFLKFYIVFLESHEIYCLKIDIQESYQIWCTQLKIFSLDLDLIFGNGLSLRKSALLFHRWHELIAKEIKTFQNKPP